MNNLYNINKQNLCLLYDEVMNENDENSFMCSYIDCRKYA